MSENNYKSLLGDVWEGDSEVEHDVYGEGKRFRGFFGCIITEETIIESVYIPRSFCIWTTCTHIRSMCA